MSKLNPLIKVDVTMCFEVRNADIFGGKDSVGYTKMSYELARTPNVSDEQRISSGIAIIANQVNASIDDVKAITFEEYIRETGEDESEDFEDE
jgi:hypothetical protein